MLLLTVSTIWQFHYYKVYSVLYNIVRLCFVTYKWCAFMENVRLVGSNLSHQLRNIVYERVSSSRHWSILSSRPSASSWYPRPDNNSFTSKTIGTLAIFQLYINVLESGQASWEMWKYCVFNIELFKIYVTCHKFTKWIWQGLLTPFKIFHADDY